MSSTEERTEQPSPHRLRKAREEGDTATSTTLTISLAFGGVLILLWLSGTFVQQRLARLLSHAFAAERADDLRTSLWSIVAPILWDGLIIVVPFIAALLVISTLAGLIQTRGLFSVRRVRLDASRMNPGEVLKQRFSTMQLFEFIKTLIKFVLVTFALYLIVLASIRELMPSVFEPSLRNGMAVVARNLLLMGSVAVAIYLIMGIVDYGHQYFEYLKRNRMTKSEVKREHRDLYGDPQINAHLREQREAMIMGPAAPPDAKASVIVTNPTHFAVALFFEADVVELPIVIGKARDDEALRMRAEALEQGIPVAERPSLARQLYRSRLVGEPIGGDELEAVAEVFRWLREAKAAPAQ